MENLEIFARFCACQIFRLRKKTQTSHKCSISFRRDVMNWAQICHICNQMEYYWRFQYGLSIFPIKWTKSRLFKLYNIHFILILYYSLQITSKILQAILGYYIEPHRKTLPKFTRNDSGIYRVVPSKILYSFWLVQNDVIKTVGPFLVSFWMLKSSKGELYQCFKAHSFLDILNILIPNIFILKAKITLIWSTNENSITSHELWKSNKIFLWERLQFQFIFTFA